jgi:hypothetical protein
MTKDIVVDNENNPNIYKINTEGSRATDSSNPANPKLPIGVSRASGSSTSTNELIDMFLLGAAPKVSL